MFVVFNKNLQNLIISTLLQRLLDTHANYDDNKKLKIE